jgi:two-component system sensor kinase FixL
MSGTDVIEAGEEQLTLETITHAAQAMAGQSSIDGVATALLNAGLAHSGAPRGVVVITADGALGFDGRSLALAPGDLIRSRPSVNLDNLPRETLQSAIVEGEPQIHFLQDQASAFPDEVEAGAMVSALCTPIIARETVTGFLYLEFDHGAALMSNRTLATMNLLATQAAMTVEAIRAFDGVRNAPIWQTRSLMIGRVAPFRWSSKLRVSDGPPEFYAILGLDADHGPVNYATMTKLQHPADYPRSQATVDDAVRRRAPLRLEWRLLRPNGEIRNLLWTGQFDTTDPEDSWLQGVVMDITDLKAADDALRVAQEDADRQLRLAWMGELAGSIVHEIAQPLGAVISSAEAALRWLDRETPDVANALQSIERIRQTGLAATRTVAGMRALSSNVQTEVAENSVNAMAAEALRLSGPQIGRALAQVEVAFDPSQPIVLCDATQMLQVMLNLIRNAVDSLREVDGRERMIKVRTSVHAGQVVAEFEDNGLGLAPDVAERLFNPLYTTKKDGMGLGLSICRRIMAAHHGSISAKPNTEFGAAFVLTLPRHVGGGAQAVLTPSAPA